MNSKKQIEKKEFTEQEIKTRKTHKINLIACLIYAILIELYFISLNVINTSAPRETFNIYTKISYMVFILLAVLVFEVAYRKQKKKLAISGIEFVLLATHILLIEKSIMSSEENLQLDILSTSYIWPIYYCLKAAIIQTRENRRRLKQISDISEIVKEEKPAKKVAKKRKT